jgi:hypothetical protein
MSPTLLELIAAARNVEASWSSGDLAAAVNALRAAADAAETELVPSVPLVPSAKFWLGIHTHRHGDSYYAFTHPITEDEFIAHLGDTFEPDRSDESVGIEQMTFEHSTPSPTSGPSSAAEAALKAAIHALDLHDRLKPAARETAELEAVRLCSAALATIGHRQLAIENPPTPPRLVITLEGGLVQDILSDRPAEVAIVDYDTDGADPADDNLVPITQDDGTKLPAFARCEDADVRPLEVASVFADFDAPAESAESP